MANTKGFVSFFILVLFSSVLVSIVILYDTVKTHSKSIDLIKLNIEMFDFIKYSINEVALNLKSGSDISTESPVSDNAEKFKSYILKTKAGYKGHCDSLKNGTVMFSKYFVFKASKEDAYIKISDFKFV